MQKRAFIFLFVIVVSIFLTACDSQKPIELSGTYLNLDKTAITKSYTFTSESDDGLFGTYTNIEDFSTLLDDGEQFERSGGWSLSDNVLTLVDTTTLGMQELLKKMGGTVSQEYEGTTWYVYKDYIIEIDGKIEPQIGDSNSFDLEANWGGTNYCFGSDNSIRCYSGNFHPRHGTYIREGNIITCELKETNEVLTLLVFDGFLYKGNCVFQKEIVK